MIYNLKKTGFTLVEILFSFVLVAIILSLGIGVLGNAQNRSNFNNELTNLVFELKLAQNNAKTGLNNNSHGIHFESDSYTIFQGSTYSEIDSSNRTEELPTSLLIENINLSGGGDDIIFTTPHGRTYEYGTVDLTSQSTNQTTTINISQLGLITY